MAPQILYDHVRRSVQEMHLLVDAIVVKLALGKLPVPQQDFPGGEFFEVIACGLLGIGKHNASPYHQQVNAKCSCFHCHI